MEVISEKPPIGFVLHENGTSGIFIIYFIKKKVLNDFLKKFKV